MKIHEQAGTAGFFYLSHLYSMIGRISADNNALNVRFKHVGRRSI